MRTLETQTLQSVLDALAGPETKPFLVGPHGASLAFTISLLTNNLPGTGSSATTVNTRTQLPHSWIILTPTHDEAAQLYQDLHFFFNLFALSTETLA
ncbi:MAG: hypothetical protein IH978_07675, partial [Nitrospinae bacterium]|nr:hypothetical protein [Nitrospinota bacterium]